MEVKSLPFMVLVLEIFDQLGIIIELLGRSVFAAEGKGVCYVLLGPC